MGLFKEFHSSCRINASLIHVCKRGKGIIMLIPMRNTWYVESTNSKPFRYLKLDIPVARQNSANLEHCNYSVLVSAMYLACSGNVIPFMGSNPPFSDYSETNS